MKKITQLLKLSALLAALFIALPGMAALPPAEEVGGAVNQDDAQKMFEAAAKGDLGGVKNAIEKKGVPVVAFELYKGYGALHYAADGGHYKVVNYLVETAHADINMEDFYLATPLHYAARGGYDWDKKDRAQHHNEEQIYLNVVQYLVENGAKMDIEDEAHRTALSYAVEADYREITDYLIEQSGIDLKNYPTNSYARPLLHYAVLSGDFEMMQDIILKNVDVNETNSNGAGNQTALMLAAQQGNEEMVTFLIEHTNAYISAVDDDGKTAIMYAEENGHEVLARYLRTELDNRTEN